MKPGRNGSVRKPKSRSAKAVISALPSEVTDAAASEAEDSDAADPTTLEAQLAADPDAVVEVSSKDEKEPPKTVDVPMKAYVKLTDILPPLPAKGDFTVETIKKSLYFFS